MKFNFKRTEFNPKRRLTKREFVIINIFINILILYFVADSFLVPKWETYDEIRDKYRTIEATKNTLEKEYEKKGEYEKEIELLDYKIENMQKEVPVYLSQEDMVLTIYDYAKETQVQIVKSDFDKENIIHVNEYLIQKEIVEKEKNQKKEDKAKDEENQFIDGIIKEQHMNLAVSGDYSNIYNFLNLIENNLRKIYVKDVVLKTNEKGKLNGNVNMLFVSFSDKNDNGKYTMDINNNKAKKHIFQPYDGYEEIIDSESGEIKKLDKPNFSLFLNTHLNNGPKIVLKESGKAETEIYYDENNNSHGKIEIIEKESGIYNYNLTLDKYTYTQENSKLKAEDGIIKLFIYSSSRKSNEDKVAITFDVINKTSLPVEINRINEDKINPRFSLGTVEGKVEMN